MKKSSTSRSISRIDTKGLVKKLAVFGIIAILFGSLVTVAALGYYSRQLPDVHTILNRFVAESTKIYDRTGEVLLFEVHGDEKRTIVELSQVSPHITNALIAAEDKNFYNHSGFSLIGISRAFLRNIFTGSTQGGSTLTQQMIKNTVLTHEKTYTRKIKELMLSREAEKEFSKDEILKVYLNTINYGGVNYGVESAAQAFFGKHAADVTLEEAAVLAALPQAPTRLSPYGNNVDQLMARKNWVLDRMAEEGYISKDEAATAKEKPLNFQELELSGIKAPHFVFYVRELLAEEFGEEIINQGGLKIITTLDWEKQEMAEDAVHSANEFNQTKGATNASLVSLDAKTGEILAMVGSQDYFNDEIDGQVNVAVGKRQPGSSIKPIIYAAAIEKGFTDKTVVYDVKTNFAVSGTPYSPNNYDLRERGPVTFRSAIQGSLNIPAVKALYLAGVDHVMKKMHDQLGYSTLTSDLDCGLSLVLGGCEVTLLDHTAAFSAFARDGEIAKPAAILEVYDKDGKKLFEFERENEKVWDAQVARTMNNILSDNAARASYFGANTPLQMGSRPVAAKTGTTNDYNDAWTIGYTPSFVTGVWVGNSDGTDMQRGAAGMTVAAPIWNSYMRNILEAGPVEYFKGPEGLPEDIKPVLAGNLGGEVEVEVDKVSGKLATAMTPEHLREKRVYRQDHTVLHYLRKDDPRGPAPEDPASADPAYTVWEEAVQDWVRRDLERRRKEAEEKGEEFNEEVFSEQPPTEFDDVHLPEYTPSISLVNPTNNQVIESHTVTFEVQTFAPRGVSRVDYYLDEDLFGTSRISPYSYTHTFGDVSTGFHRLKTVVFDDVDNSAEVIAELNFRLPYQAPDINWTSPRDNATFFSSNFPLTLNLQLTKTSGVSSVSLYYKSGEGDGPRTHIHTFSNISQNSLTATWNNSMPPGSYELIAEITVTTGNSYTATSSLGITIRE